MPFRRPPRRRDPWLDAPCWAIALRDQLTRMETSMADKTKELEAAFDELVSTVTRIATDIDNQLKVIANPGTPDAAVDAAIAKAQSLVATMKQKAADLEADDPPAPTP